MRKTALGLIAAAMLAIGALPAAAQTPLTMTFTRDGAPAPNVQVVLHFADKVKTPAGVTQATGVLELTLGMANRVKPTRMQVVIYDCPNDQHLVLFVEAGAEAPENIDCKKRIAGWIWFGRARAVVIDVARGTMQVHGGQSFLSTRTGRLIAGGGAAVVGLVALSAGGDSNSGASNNSNSNNSGSSGSGNPPPTAFDPNGNYPVANTLASDPGGHASFILMEGNTVLVIAFTGGSNLRLTCPPGSKWTLINATFTINATTGQKQITGEGRGTAAGRSNVLFRFSGTMETMGSSQGQLTGQLTVGAGGELPGGQATVYNVAGRKQ